MPFSQKLYDEFDEPCKDLFTKWLLGRGYTVTRHEENYLADIEAVNADGEFKFFEVEHKDILFTSAEDFPYPTVSFLGRKKKYGDFWYVIMSHLCVTPHTVSPIVMCHSSIIYRPEFLETLRMNTEHRHGDEGFYRVPKHLCRWGHIG